MSLYHELYNYYQKIVETKPIILNITNSVTQDFMANALLALGASPIMSEDLSEINELSIIVDSLNLNIGTLQRQFNAVAINAAIAMQTLKKPVILDPVGAGATSARTDLALALAPYATIIRGNASEIMALNGVNGASAGVDTLYESSFAEQSGRSLVGKYANTIVISGKEDLILSSKRTFKNSFGDALMTKVTGMGCVLSAVIASFAAINKDFARASYLALVFYTLCAEKAITISATPAKFKIEFIDTLYAPDWQYIECRLLQL